VAQTGRRDFGPETTTDEVLEGIDLSGRTALVTGASGGLGAETARALASRGARVILAARDREKLDAVAESIRRATAAEVETVALELGSLAGIRAAAGRVLERHQALHVLVNNAGVMACPESRTEDGFELQFGVNHLGHFLLTGLLAPALLRGGSARIVCVSSRGHQQSPVRWDDLFFEKEPYDKWAAYGQSKTANVLHAVELERRLGGRGVHAFAVHPGVIPTDLSRHMEREDFEHIRRRSGGQLRLKTVAQGAATSVYAATAPELEGRGGVYLEDCHVAEVNDDPESREGVRSYALDPAAAARLWELSEELVGQRLPV